LIILLAIVFGWPVPLIATQLLFVNLLTDAFPAFALGMEGKEKGVMLRKPRDPKEAIINKSMMHSVGIRAIFVTISALGAFMYGFYYLGNYMVAMSMCFFTLVAVELLVVYPSKSDAFMGLSGKLFGNKFLNVSMLLSFSILVAVMYVPVLNDLFTTVPLSASQMLVCLGMCLVSVFGFEVSKLALRAKS